MSASTSVNGRPSWQRRASCSSKTRALPMPVRKSFEASSRSFPTSSRFRRAKPPTSAPTPTKVTRRMSVSSVSTEEVGMCGITTTAIV